MTQDTQEGTQKIPLLIGGLGVGPAVEVMDIVVSHFLSITEYLLTVHAESLMV